MRSTSEQGRTLAIWPSFRLGLIAVITLAPCMAFPFPPTLADVAITPAFRDGRADRQAWEAWFGGLSGTYQAGAEFWASHRSDPNPPDCSSANDVAFRSGCEEAKKRLSKSDYRRRAEADYKAGWNSPLDVADTGNTASTSPPQTSSPPPSQDRSRTRQWLR